VNNNTAHGEDGNGFRNQIQNLAKLFHSGQYSQVLEQAMAVIEKKPNHVVLLNILGATHSELKNWEQASNYFAKIVRSIPSDDAHYNLGVTQYQLNNNKEAIASFRNALELNPDHAEAHSNLGLIFSDLGQQEKAITHFKRAIGIRPEYFDAHNNLGIALNAMRQFDEAIARYNVALNIDPNKASTRAEKLYIQRHICDWEIPLLEEKKVEKLGLGQEPVQPFVMLPMEDAPDRHRLRSQIYSKNKFPQTPLPLNGPPSKIPNQLKVGYFSADFHDHVMMNVMKKVFDTHDRTKFDIHGFSIANTKRKQSLLIESHFDKFHDVSVLNDKEIAETARSKGIDIAVDLTGYTRNHRTGIFAYRAAPVQINCLGYPGTLGAGFMDYIIADENLIPVDHQRFYSEKPIYLPHHYLAQSTRPPYRKKLPTRSELGLTETGFIFCAINGTYKINSNVYAVWMHLLHKVRGSVLWLLKSNDQAEINLRQTANASGIDPHRLVFADKVSYEDYLIQIKHADIYLDTFVYNAGATAGDVLWSGVPIVTKLGRSYTARMAGSLLNSIGLPELITKTDIEYEQLALNLATNPRHLEEIKNKIRANRHSTPLFNTKLYTTHLESGYTKAYRAYFDGTTPSPIHVPA